MLLVTGITGHSGRYFLKELINNKYQNKIRCIVRVDSNITLLDNSGLNIEKAIGDLNDKKFISKCMKNVDTILHIASIRYTLDIFKAALDNNVKRVICVHTTGIYSKFKQASKEYKDIECKLNEMIKHSDIKVTILRPTMICGDLCDHNMSKFIKMVDRLTLFPVINKGKGLIQPVNARDLGRAYFKVLTMPGEKAKYEYNLSGEKPIKIIDALYKISECLGKKTKFISIPLTFGVFIAKCFKILSIGKIDYVEKVQRMSEDRCFSHKSAKEDFGYNPESFDVGIIREVKQYLKE